MLSASARWPPLFPRTSSARMPSWVRCRSISTSSTSSFFFYALWAAAATDCRRLKKGPDARRRPTAAREAYSLYVERAAEGAPTPLQNDADGPFSAAGAGEEGLEVGPEVVDDDAVTLGGGVDAVGLVEGRVARDAVEQEGHEGHAALARHLDVQLAEISRVARAVVGRHFHPGQEHFRSRFLEPRHDGVEVVPHRPEVLGTQGVVGPEGHDDDIGLVLERPVHPPQSPRRGIP